MTQYEANDPLCERSRTCSTSPFPLRDRPSPRVFISSSSLVDTMPISFSPVLKHVHIAAIKADPFCPTFVQDREALVTAPVYEARIPFSGNLQRIPEAPMAQAAIIRQTIGTLTMRPVTPRLRITHTQLPHLDLHPRETERGDAVSEIDCFKYGNVVVHSPSSASCRV
jgi:hypothetical protein